MALTLLPTAAMAEGEPAEVPAGEGSAPEYVAQIGDKQYATLQAAVDAAKNKTVKLIADTTENVTISTYGVTLDLNGFTLNGSTGKREPALTVSNARVTVQDSSAAQTGTIKRDDTAENSGISSHYVIDVQGGSGFLLFKSGNVTNGSGAGGTKGASLVRIGDDKYKVQPTMTIKGGTFTQDNFIALKVDYGTLYVTGGTINSKNSYAVENWLNATIKDNAVVNGNVSSWTYSGGSNSTTTISGGTVNGDVESISYDGTAGKKASVSITGGVVNGTLMTGIYGSATAPTKDMATIEVTSGTFKNDPSKYVVEDSAVTKNEDNTFGVAKAYLAKVGETSYYTMDDAFKAQTASGEAIVLLRDYTTGSTFNSGSINRTVDLDGHTWTYTGTDVNSAAFEINYSDVIPSRGCGQAAISTYLSVRQIWTGQWRRFRRTFRTGSGRSLTMTSRSIPQTDSILSCTGTSLRITGSIRRRRCWRQCGIPQFRTAAGHTGWKCRTSCSISTTSHIWQSTSITAAAVSAPSWISGC